LNGKNKERVLKRPALLDLNAFLEGTEELVKVFVTSSKTAEKKEIVVQNLTSESSLSWFFSRLGVIGRSMFDVRCWTFIFQNNPVLNY